MKQNGILRTADVVAVARSEDKQDDTGVCKTTTGYLRMADTDGKKYMVGPFTSIQNVMPIVDTVILYPVIRFINATCRNKNAPFLLLKCTPTWCTSPLSV